MRKLLSLAEHCCITVPRRTLANSLRIILSTKSTPRASYNSTSRQYSTHNTAGVSVCLACAATRINRCFITTSNAAASNNNNNNSNRMVPSSSFRRIGSSISSRQQRQRLRQQHQQLYTAIDSHGEDIDFSALSPSPPPYLAVVEQELLSPDETGSVGEHDDSTDEHDDSSIDHDESDQQTQALYSALLDMRFRQDWQSALQIVSSILDEGGVPARGILSRVISVCKASNQGKAAFDILKLMHKYYSPVPTIAFNSVLAACTAKDNPNNINVADKVWKMRNELRVRPDIYSYNILLNVYAEHGCHEELLRLIKEMKERDHFVPDHHTYAIALKSFAAAGDIQKTTQFLEEVIQSKLPFPTENVFVHLVIKAEQCNQIKFMASVYDMAKRFNFPLSDLFVAARMRAFRGDPQKLEEALREAEELKIVGPNVYGELICADASLNKAQRLEQLLAEMEQRGIDMRPTVAIRIIRELGAKHLIGEAMKVFQFYHKHCGKTEFDVQVFHTLASVFVDSGCGQLESLINRPEIAPVARKSIDTYNLLLKELYLRRRYLDMITFYYSNIQPNPELVPNEVTVVTLLNACARRHDTATARKLFTQLEEENVFVHNTRTYNALLHVYALAADSVGTSEVLQEMRNRNIPINQLTYHVIMKGLKNNPYDVKYGLLLLDKVIQSNVKVDSYFFNTALDMCSKANMPDKALEIFAMMPTLGVKVDNFSWNTVFSSLANAKDPRAFDWYERMKREAPHLIHTQVTETIHMKACKNLGDYERGAKLFAEVEEHNRKHNVKPIAAFYNTWLALLRRRGTNNTDEILELFDRRMPELGIVHDRASYEIVIRHLLDNNDIRFKQYLDRAAQQGIKLNKTLHHACVKKAQIEEKRATYKDPTPGGRKPKDGLWTRTPRVIDAIPNRSLSLFSRNNNNNNNGNNGNNGNDNSVRQHQQQQ